MAGGCLTTHVLDTALGLPARGLCELVFEAGAYLRKRGAAAGDGVETFLEALPVRFRVTDPATHLHVPLLLGDFSYATYRGS